MMMNETSKLDRPTRETILQAIVDLCEHNQAASRSRIIERTGLRASIVDEHVGNLRDDGLIRTLSPGCFEPVDQTIDRAVSVTYMARGRAKIEIGDDVVQDLSPREAFALAKALSGVLFAFGVGK